MSTTPPPPANPYATPAQPLNPSDEKLWATLIHIGGILFGFLPSLIGYLVLERIAARSSAPTAPPPSTSS